YDTVPASDGDFIVAVGNDAQFQRFCAVLQKPDWPRDPRFATNTERVRNRHALMAMIAEVTPTRTMDDWIAALQAVAVPCGPVNSIPAAFADPQAVHREMTIAMDNPVGDPTPLKLIGNPLKLSDTPVTYRRRPPRIGEHSRAVLAETLGLGDHEIETLIEKGVVADG
ncbi:MAG: CoA transferase, partial [Pseudomonadota bacterium]